MGGGNIQSSLPAADDEFTEEELLGEGIEVTGEEVHDEIVDDTAQAEIEAQAYAKGWRPLDQYRGPAGRWVDAQTFLQRGEDFEPFIKAERNRLRSANVAMEAEVRELREMVTGQSAQLKQLLDYSRTASKRGYNQAVAELKQQQRAAVAEGDTARFDQIDQQLEQMQEVREEAREPEPPPPVPQQNVDVDPAYGVFLRENAWFRSDRLLSSAMIAEHNAIIEESPGMPLIDQLELAKRAVMTRFPKKFGLSAAPAQEPAPPVRRPAGTLAPRRQTPTPPAPDGNATFASIADPADRTEARKGFAIAKKSMPDLKEAEYVEMFLDPHGDVLQTMRKNGTLKDKRRAPGV